MYVSKTNLNTRFVNDEWYNFITEEIEPQNIRKNIVDSWKRCRELEVNPYESDNVSVLSQEELIKKLYEKEKLIKVIQPYMENLYKIVEGSGFIVFLTDNEANVLHVLGDKDILNDYSTGCNFKVGANWSEKCVGTSSIGMVLIEGNPIQIVGEEHYCYKQQQWTCSGIPIRDAEGKIIAAISMAGKSENAHSHTLGMLVATEMAIENQLKIIETNEKLLMTTQHHKAVVESVSEGILSIDKFGIVTFMNESAGKILFCDYKNAIGKHINEVLDYEAVILKVLKTGKGYIDREFIINSKRGRIHFVKSAIPIRGKNGEITGIVDIFREIKQVKRLVNQMVGAHARFTFEDIVGKSEELLEAKRLAASAAKCTSNVLIMGESGTGKELFAQAVHNASSRSQEPFVAVNCGAIPRELIESEFFGYEEGAFTGAQRGGRPGKFEMAAGGTLFLDEIGEMTMDMQVRLLRVLQEKEVTRIGGNKTFPVDVRIIAATNKNLNKEIKEGTFRNDLFWRLNVLTINIPPLCRRNGDIPLLMEYFLDILSKEHHKQYTLCSEAMKILNNYSWPGNVRELENVLERSVNFAEKDHILPNHLPKNIINNSRKFKKNDQIVSLEEAEYKAIVDAVAYCKGNITWAAKILGVARNTLYTKLKKYEIEC